MQVKIDDHSGYCFGVEFAVKMAEDYLEEDGSLYCLGDIVHNDMEVNRLKELGLKVIDREELKSLKDCKVLIRAHGEPPETYHLAYQNNIELVDASCPVVLKLQNRVKNAFDKIKDEDGQLLIYGKQGHAEVKGLSGQTEGQAVVVMTEEDLQAIDFKKPITLFSQTTKSTKGFYAMKASIEKRAQAENGNLEQFKAHDSICRQVSNREPQLKQFAEEHEVILFVSSPKSSNGKALYSVCKHMNERSYFVANGDDLQVDWLAAAQSVGICGATSTPMWLMEQVANKVQELSQSH